MDKTALQEQFKHRRDYDERRWFYLANPTTLNTVKECTHQGASAARYAAELKALIETMESYQQLIYERVRELTTAPYHHELTLTRERRTYRDNKVFYYLEVKKVYEVPSISPETVERTTYPGTERHKALADFAAYQKSHPGIIAEMDIAKGKWER